MPAAPVITAAAGSRGSARLTWSTAVDHGSAITGYVVTPGVAGVAEPPITFASSATTQAVTGLADGQASTFTVAATKIGDGTGPASR